MTLGIYQRPAFWLRKSFHYFPIVGETCIARDNDKHSVGAGTRATPASHSNAPSMLPFCLVSLGRWGLQQGEFSGLVRGAAAVGSTVANSPHAVTGRLHSWRIKILSRHCSGGLGALVINNLALVLKALRGWLAGTGGMAREPLGCT